MHNDKTIGENLHVMHKDFVCFSQHASLAIITLRIETGYGRVRSAAEHSMSQQRTRSEHTSSLETTHTPSSSLHLGRRNQFGEMPGQPLRRRRPLRPEREAHLL